MVAAHVLVVAEALIPAARDEGLLLRGAAFGEDLTGAREEAPMRGGGDEDEAGDGARMARSMRHRHHPAVARADDGDRAEAEMTAQRLHVGDVLIERPARGVVIAGGAALAAMVEIDELGGVREGREQRLVAGMIRPRPAMDEEQHGLFAHRRAVGDQARALDIEIEASVANGGVHDRAPGAGRRSMARG